MGLVLEPKMFILKRDSRNCLYNRETSKGQATEIEPLGVDEYNLALAALAKHVPSDIYQKHFSRKVRRHVNDYADLIGDKRLATELSWELLDHVAKNTPKTKRTVEETLEASTRPRAELHTFPTYDVITKPQQWSTDDSESNESFGNDVGRSETEGVSKLSLPELLDSVDFSADFLRKTHKNCLFHSCVVSSRKVPDLSKYVHDIDPYKSEKPAYSRRKPRDHDTVYQGKSGLKGEMKRNLIDLSRNIVFHLMRSLLEQRQYADLLQLFFVYLLGFHREKRGSIDIEDYRVIRKILLTTIDLRFSDIAVSLLYDMFGSLRLVKHDIISDITALYCARNQVDQAKHVLQEVLAGLSSRPSSLRATIHCCSALCMYAEWILEGQELSKCDQDSFSIKFLKEELDLACVTTWENSMVLPNYALRMLLHMFCPTNMRKVLSILTDNHNVCPLALDILELKMLVLQHYLRHNTNDAATFKLFSDGLNEDTLIQVTTRYLRLSRGEVGSLCLAYPIICQFSLPVRLSFLFVNLKSSCSLSIGWRWLVDEIFESLFENKYSVLQMYKIIDDALPVEDKINYQSMFFLAHRSSITSWKAGDRVLMFLLSPFFILSSLNIKNFGLLLGPRGTQRKSIVSVMRKTECDKESDSLVFERDPSPEVSLKTQIILDGFKKTIFWLLSADIETCSDEITVIDLYELSLRIEVALSLNPSITDMNVLAKDALKTWLLFRKTVAKLMARA